MATEREPTGIQGFDDLVQGGFPKNSVTLVSGSPGTGKSIFSMQFLHTGAKRYNQPVLYFSLEQKITDLHRQAKQFGMDFPALEEKGLAKFVFYDITKRRLPKGETYSSLILQEAENMGAKRVVIDSLSPLADFPISVNELADYGLLEDFDKVLGTTLSENLMTRMQVHRMIMTLKDLDATCLVTSQIPRESVRFSSDGVSEFLSDAVITLHYLGMAGSTRTIRVEKMRETSHYDDFADLKITNRGLEVSTAPLGEPKGGLF